MQDYYDEETEQKRKTKERDEAERIEREPGEYPLFPDRRKNSMKFPRYQSRNLDRRGRARESKTKSQRRSCKSRF